MAGNFGLQNKLKVKNVRVYTGTGTITMLNEGVLIVKKAVGAATPVTLPPNPDPGDHVIVKDGLGDAATHNITLSGASAATIDGAATLVISANYGYAILEWNGSEWGVVANGAQSSGSPTFTAVTAPSVDTASAGALTLGGTNATSVVVGAASVPEVAPGPLTSAPGASTAAAGSTTTDATVLPAATARVYPTTAADDTKGVRIHANDKVTGRLIFIGNGVANKILKVYGPSGAVINGGSADAAFSSVSGKGAILYCLSSGANTWLAW